jgi:hypothetical protein
MAKLKTLGVFHFPWEAIYVSKGDPGRTPLALYKKAVWYKANPRNEDYMRTLFAELYPEGVFLNIDHNYENWRQIVSEADRIVLIYPDATGLGFESVESEVELLRKSWTGVRVLNGRRRDFAWSISVRRGLRMRRLLERTMILEIITMFLMVLSTPFLVAIDLMKGRK